MSKRFDIVGSLLRPEYLLRYKREIENRDDIKYPFYNDLLGYEEAEDRAIREIIKEQIDADIEVISDGEFSKSLWHLDFVWGLSGVRRYISKKGYIFRDHVHDGKTLPKDGAKGFETRRDVGIEVESPLSGKNHNHNRIYKKIKEYANGHKTKLCIPSPAHIYGEFLWSDVINYNKVYKDNEDFKKGLINAYKEFVDEFAEIGGTILQIDDCLWQVFAEDNKNSPFAGKNPADNLAIAREFVDLNNELIDYVKSKDIKAWAHNCRGNYQSRSMADGTYDSIADLFLSGQRYDRFYLEWDDERAGSLDGLNVFKNRNVEVVLGLLSSKTKTLDNETRVIDLLEKAINILPKENILLSHQCGFASCDNGNELNEIQQWEKIRQGQEIAKKVFGE
ncbi:MAG: cobalamin-independent methionine synthase II family protein [Defluviitaleaceae bacterium]|nr:cobalamin-independent methionine synthase II family protein [Defluviitaleaceae bacterium]